MRKLLFVHDYPPGQLSSFLRQDLEILRGFCQVEEMPLYAPEGGLHRPLASPSVWRAIARNELVFGWFGGCAPAVIAARILGRRSLLVAGGADVVSIPEIGYGVNLRHKFGLFVRALGFRLADRVLLFSDSSRRSLAAWRGVRADNCQTLYLGVDVDYFRPGGSKDACALTVAHIKETNLRRKGVSTFVEAAHATPEIPYVLVGKPIERTAVDKITAAASPNLTYLGFVSAPQLLAQYQRAKVYAQLSMHEGFGVALAEAMACGCIPVVTMRGAIPEVVGDTGVYVPLEDPPAAAEAIRDAVGSDDAKGRRARERIAELFPLTRRRDELRAAVEAALPRP